MNHKEKERKRMNKIYDEQFFADMEARIPKGEVRTRFAPSPTGYMHVGGMRTALYTWLIAKKAGGKFLLRIEDTDQNRFVEGATEVIYRTLRDAGLTWDEGPDVGGPVGPYIQTQRKDLYLPYAERLIQRGHAYRCFCEKTESEEDSGDFSRAEDPCRSLSPEESEARAAAGEPFVIRQRIPREGSTTFHDEIFGDITAPNADLDDQVLMKRDGLPTYNFANVIDDHLMGITHVMRGMEYLSSTPRYNYLYTALGWEIPTYIHLPTVMRDATHKLSKRDGDAYYSDYIEKGFLTEALINYLALVGWNPGTDQEFFTLPELVEVFDIHRINNSPGIFDVNKLEWMNSQYVAKMDPQKYLETATPWFDKVLAGKNMDYRRLAELMQSRTDIFSRIPEKIAFLAEMPEYDTAIFFNKKQKSDETVAKEVLPLLIPVLEGIGDWTEANIHDVVMEKIQAWERKTGSVLWPMRISISGQESTPGGAFEIAYLLGKEETLKRMKASLERLG